MYLYLKVILRRAVVDMEVRLYVSQTSAVIKGD
jgi:hypothetical protein